MSYSQEVIALVAKSPKTLGNQLGRWAIHLNFPVAKIAKATGASRQTVYNWFYGGEVLSAYRVNVESVLRVLSTSPTPQDAWRKLCKAFNLET